MSNNAYITTRVLLKLALNLVSCPLERYLVHFFIGKVSSKDNLKFNVYINV